MIARTGPLDCRGDRVSALPPTRKGRQGRDMTDKCAPHPWVKAQNRPPKDYKKSILLLFTLCIFLHSETPYLYTKKTRTTSAIYPPPKDQKETNNNKTNLHHSAFLNTKPWDSHPYASPEGLGTTPSEEYQRWPKTGPLGAAMRLTALR